MSEWISWDQAFLRCTTEEPIKKLPGFDRKRGHFVPSRQSPAVDRFVEKILSETFEREWRDLYVAAKDLLELRRVQLSGTPEEKCLRGPGFEYRFRVRQGGSVRHVRWVRELELRRPDPIFDALFPFLFDECVAPVGADLPYDTLTAYFETLRERTGGTLTEDGREMDYLSPEGVSLHIDEQECTVRIPGKSGVGLLSSIRFSVPGEPPTPPDGLWYAPPRLTS